MNAKIPDGAGRIILDVNKEITLDLVNCENSTRTFKIIKVLGDGGTAIAYKVSYDGADNNRYIYVLKELYPVPAEGKSVIRRSGVSLNIDEYDDSTPSSHRYKRLREQFEAAYQIQNQLATGEDAVSCMTTSLPIGLYEDHASSTKGNYAVYGLFQYQVGKTLKGYTEKSLLELIDIQRKIAEVVKAYHEHGFLWLDIKDANVNVVGAGAVQSVSMFDFGSLFSKMELMNYSASGKTELALSFTPTSSEMLLPEELESILSSEQSGGFCFVNPNHQMEIHTLGEFGEQTDIFLLGSLMFKRLMGKAPTVQDCEQLQEGTFDMARFERLKGQSRLFVSRLKEILSQCLNYDDRGERYESVSAYMTDLKELYLELCTQEGLSIVEGNARNYVTICCERYLSTILNGDTDGKFKNLKKLQGRFESRVSLRSDRNQKTVLPSTAIDSAPSLEGSDDYNRLVFLYGDGGMGKSTALYDYMRETASVTPIYIELSQYRFIDRDSSFVFKKIFEDICNKFIDAAGFVEKERLSRIEDILMESLKVLDSNDPRPQYVLLLDGYNEISREDRGGFDVEIARIIDTWKNCRIVITGRNLPTDYEGKEIPTYEHFSRFEFIGISEDERRSLIETNYPDRTDRIQKDERLWEVLRIPMFMGMFLQLNIDTSAVVHTRGEILDQFITKTEKDAAEEIAKRQTGNAENAALRRFIVCFSLTFAANTMDADRLFSLDKNTLSSRINLGNLLYLAQRVGEKKVSVYDCVTANTVTKAAIGFDDDRFDFKQMKIQKQNPTGISMDELEKLAMADMFSIDSILHILSVEAGYFYRTTNGAYEFTHQYFRDYFAAKHIQNILNTAQTLDNYGLTRDEQLQFTKDYGLDYTWSDDVCILLGEIIGDYKNEPGYSEP